MAEQTDYDEYMSPNVSYEKLQKSVDAYSIRKRLLVDFVLLFWYMLIILSVFLYPVILLAIVLYTKYGYLFVFGYYIWLYIDRKSPENNCRKKHVPTITRRYLRQYFPVGLVKTVELPATKNYLLCTFPHAMVCFAGTVNFAHDQRPFRKLFPDLELYFTTLGQNFFVPIIRDLFLYTGFISVSEKSITNTLNRKPNSGTTVTLIVGGAAEVLVTNTDEYKVILKKRKGFIRIALKTGTSLVPVFCFGENQLYAQVKPKFITSLQDKLYALTGYGFALFKGRRVFGIDTLLPRIVPLITVVGAAIDLPKIENPSPELVDEYHGKFCDALYELFETHKKIYDPIGADARLIFV